MISNDLIYATLGELGYTGSLDDRLYKYLGDLGYLGAQNDRLRKFFTAQEYTGSFTDQYSQWRIAGYPLAPDLEAEITALFTNGEQGAWYDPSDFSTMFQDAAGTIPVTAVGQAVGRILDKSGRGNHATQTTNTKRPVLQQDANGKYYLLFDGIDDALQTASVNFTGTDKVTVWAGVRKFNNTGTFSPVVRLGGTLDTTNGFYLAAPSGGSDYLFNSYITIQQVANAALGTFPSPHTAVLTCITNVSAPLVRLRVNSTQFENSNTASQGVGTFANKSINIGSDLGLTTYFSGRLYSLIVRGAQSTDTQITNTEAYVNSRTGAY